MISKGFFKHGLVTFLITFLLAPPAFAQTGTVARDFGIVNRTGQQQKYQDVRSLSTDPNAQLMIPTQREEIQDSSDTLLQNISVHVLGDVTNPGVQKVKMTERAADVMKLAQPNRSTTRIIQVRTAEGEKKYYDLYQYYYFGNLDHNPFIKENDTIFVPNQKGAVRIEGPIARPGIYELSHEKHLDQIVRLAGGFTASLSKIYPIKVVRLNDAGTKNILEVSTQENDLKSFEIKKGDIIIVPDIINAARTFDYSVEALPGENTVYPTSVPDVFVVGSVTQAGPYPYKSHLTVKDYIGFAGADGSANLRSVRILRGSKKKKYKLDANVQAGDVIIVDPKSSEETMKYISYISAILSVTLSAYVLKAYLED